MNRDSLKTENGQVCAREKEVWATQIRYNWRQGIDTFRHFLDLRCTWTFVSSLVKSTWPMKTLFSPFERVSVCVGGFERVNAHKSELEMFWRKNERREKSEANASDQELGTPELLFLSICSSFVFFKSPRRKAKATLTTVTATNGSSFFDAASWSPEYTRDELHTWIQMVSTVFSWVVGMIMMMGMTLTWKSWPTKVKPEVRATHSRRAHCGLTRIRVWKTREPSCSGKKILSIFLPKPGWGFWDTIIQHIGPKFAFACVCSVYIPENGRFSNAHESNPWIYEGKTSEFSFQW